MGHWITKLSELWQDEEASVAMLGLDSAGKTTILYCMKLNERVSTIPTIGFNVEKVSPCKGLSMTIWDVGGQGVIRPLWKHYLEHQQGIIYVVDSSDHIRFEESREELFRLLEYYYHLADVPILILANKQDLPGARNVDQIIDAFTLNKLKQDWFIQPCCAKTGSGIFEGFAKLSEMIRNYKKRVQDSRSREFFLTKY